MPDSVPLLKLRWLYASICAKDAFALKDSGAAVEILIETTPLLEECLQTARRVLGDEDELTVLGNQILREHGGNIAKAKAKRLIERFISRFKARRRARQSG